MVGNAEVTQGYRAVKPLMDLFSSQRYRRLQRAICVINFVLLLVVLISEGSYGAHPGTTIEPRS